MMIGTPSLGFAVSGGGAEHGRIDGMTYSEKPIIYLSRSQLAHMIGVKPATLGRYRLPPEDALIGTVRGWLPVTIEKWMVERPGKGRKWET